MKKKLMIGSIFAVLMLITLSFVSVVGSETTTEKKESPLYKIRTIRAIGEKVVELYEKIITKFFQIRGIFSLPFNLINRGNSPYLCRTSSCTYKHTDDACWEETEVFYHTCKTPPC